MTTQLSVLAHNLLAAAQPQEAVQIPEGSNLTLMALGLAGVLIGRRLAMHRRNEGDGDAED